MYVFADPSQFITYTAELEPLGFQSLIRTVLDVGILYLITVQESNNHANFSLDDVCDDGQQIYRAFDVLFSLDELVETFLLPVNAGDSGRR